MLADVAHHQPVALKRFQNGGLLHFARGKEFDPDKTKALEEGGMAIMAPGEPMFGCTEEETVIQLHGTGPWGIEYVNPEDDPRK